METPTVPDLQEAIDKARTAGRDPRLMREASIRLDQTREAIRRKVGADVDLSVEAVRELRDGK